MNFNIGGLENLLQRKLTKKEYHIIKEANGETNMNQQITKIFDLANKQNLYIPELTNLDGNCIFESLKYHNLCENIDEFRCGLAYILMLFKNKKYFIPNQELTLEEIFNLSNNIDSVLCLNTESLYKYTFETMCYDLSTNTSWTRLNVELLFLTLTVLFNIEIIIFHNNGHITNIKTIQNENTISIYLGLIDECHYIPICDKNKIDTTTYTCPTYTNNINTFKTMLAKLLEDCV
jgi:hypothetical protein